MPGGTTLAGWGDVSRPMNIYLLLEVSTGDVLKARSVKRKKKVNKFPSSSIKEEPFVLTMAVEFRPHVTAETLEACALIGLHFMAEEKRLCVKWQLVS